MLDFFKYGSGSDGYWSSSQTIAEIKYPSSSYNLIFLFDQSSGHTAYGEESLNRMNVNPGGSQPMMRDTMWGGRTQKMVDANGIPKGMRQILVERGIDVRGMKADNMRKTLKEMHDFNTCGAEAENCA